MNAGNVNFVHNQGFRQDRPPNSKRWLFLLIIVAVLFVGGCITRQIVGEYEPQNPDQYDPVTLEPKSPDGLLKKLGHFVFSKENNLDGYSKDRINLLLLGMGGIGHDGPFLTDTNIIASIKPSTGQIAMISIPRDLGVKIPGHDWHKINHANAYGEADKSGSGGELAKKVIERTFDINIHYYARVDFQAFEEIVDEVGGLTVNVDTGFEDPMYPADNYEYQTLEFSSGIQTMYGERALQFVRSRHGNNGEGSDFARARRQQKVLFALKEKILSFSTLLNPIKINGIKNSLERHITTDMDFADIMAFVKLIKELNTNSIITMVLDDSPNNFLENSYTNEGAFILSPKAGDFDDINTMIKNIFEEEQINNDTPEQVQPKIDYSYANIEIQNGTWSVGMAARMRKRLEDKNFYIETIGNTEEKPIVASGIFKLTNKNVNDIVSALQSELHIPVKEYPPENVQATSTTDILILLGGDIEG